jgi:uncharacterized DUF497 family protein
MLAVANGRHRDVQIDELIWDDWNVGHISEHRVEPEEVESLVGERHHLARRAGTTRYGLPRYHLYGRTEAGRYLFVVLDREAEGAFYVVTARDMGESERRLFRKARGQ